MTSPRLRHVLSYWWRRSVSGPLNSMYFHLDEAADARLFAGEVAESPGSKQRRVHDRAA